MALRHLLGGVPFLLSRTSPGAQICQPTYLQPLYLPSLLQQGTGNLQAYLHDFYFTHLENFCTKRAVKHWARCLGKQLSHHPRRYLKDMSMRQRHGWMVDLVLLGWQLDSRIFCNLNDSMYNTALVGTEEGQPYTGPTMVQKALVNCLV